MSIFAVINLVFSGLFIAGAVYFWRKSVKLKSVIDTSTEIDTDGKTLVLLTVPKNNDKTPQAAEQMFAAMHGIFRSTAAEQPEVSFEIVAKNKQIKFYVFMPSVLKDFVLSQIYAQYPNVEMTVVPEPDDYAVVAEDKAVAITELALKKPTVYPIKTFVNFEVDPLSGITGALSAVGQDEQIWVQTIIRPKDDDWQDMAEAEIKVVKDPPKKPKTFRSLVIDETKNMGKEAFKAFVPSAFPEKKEEKKDDKKELPGPVQQAIKGIEEKVTRLGFETTIRLVVAASDELSARSRLEQVVGAYKQFNTINTNSFVIKDIVNDRAALELYTKRTIGNPEMIFNVTELASIYHYPSESVSTPTIAWSGSKKGEPPANLPIEGSVPADDLTIISQTNFRTSIQKFGLKKEDRRLHSYIIGRTGTGKSTLLENMIYDDIREGRGVAVIDPHGQLIEHVLTFIPQERIKDVVYFNPADADNPVGFNVLESVNPEHRSIVASGVVGIFKKIFGESWGPRLEYILRNVILALVEYPNSTLLGVNRVLTDNAFRRKVVNSVKDPVIRDFFVNEYEKYEQKFRQEAIAPIQNKVGQFLSSSIIRNIIGQPHSTVNIEEIMNEGKILLADLSTGKIGEDNSALLGSMLITKVQLAAMRRVEIPEEARRDFYLYVDEFQNFATDSFATILSEARKYRLNLVMVNQYISQMPEVVANAVFGNVGTMIAFRVGPRDAEVLQSEFAPVFDANDLVNLPNRQIYIKMAIDGVTVPAFSAGTLPPPKLDYDYSQEIINSSRETHASPRDDVEEYIADWSAPIDLSQENAKDMISAAADRSTSEKNIEFSPRPAVQTEVGESVEKKLDSTQVAEAESGGVSEDKTKNKKIEILKDRFDRSWYAVSGQADATESNLPTKAVQEGTVVKVAEPVEDILIPESRPTAVTATNDLPVETMPVTDVRVGESDQNLPLISWEQAEELNRPEVQKPESRPQLADDLEPIDEL